MTVTKSIAKLEHSAVRLTVTVPKEELRAEYDKMIKSYSANAQLPGFRKGKVPREVLERKFGEGLKAESIGRAMEGALRQLFEDAEFPAESKPLPYSQPAVKDEPKYELDADLTFDVTYDVFPEVKLGTWKGLDIEVPAVSVEAEDVSRELEQVRERNAVVLDKDDKAKVAKGDVVTVNYCELDASGVPLAGSERQDFVFTVGSGHNVFKFDDEVVGLVKGGSKDFDKTYPADFEDKELAGSAKKLRVAVTAVKEKQLPKLDDDLAQDVSEKFKTLADLKADIEAGLEKKLAARLREVKVNAYLEKVLETTTIDLPEAMVRLELESRWRQFARRMNVEPDRLLQIVESSGSSYGAMLEQWRPETEKALKARLAVEKLMGDLSISVADEELTAEYAAIAASANMEVAEVAKHYEREEMRDYLREDLKERKLFDQLLADVKVKKGKKAKYLDLVPDNR